MLFLHLICSLTIQGSSHPTLQVSQGGRLTAGEILGLRTRPDSATTPPHPTPRPRIADSLLSCVGGVHIQPEVVTQLRGADVHGALPRGDPGAGPRGAQDRKPELRRGWWHHPTNRQWPLDVAGHRQRCSRRSGFPVAAEGGEVAVGGGCRGKNRPNPRLSIKANRNPAQDPALKKNSPDTFRVVS